MKIRTTKIKCPCSISTEVSIKNPDWFDWKSMRFICEGCGSTIKAKYKKDKKVADRLILMVRVERYTMELQTILAEDEKQRAGVGR